jgi:monothiol glutaredoxin
MRALCKRPLTLSHAALALTGMGIALTNPHMPLSEPVREHLSTLIGSHRVVLFMKGNRRFPQCGFSAQVVEILNELIPSFETVNVLADPAVREGIKEFSSWPTIPQLYVDGQFVGGCDIVKELHASGQLATMLGAAAKAVEPPAIEITERAAAALRGADEGGADRLRLEIDSSFKYDLFFGPPAADDLEVTSGGVTLRLDKKSASRASGMTIDFVAGASGGFKITNPNEPPHVKPLRPAELKKMMDEGQPIELIDVRTPGEQAMATIPKGRLLDRDAAAHLESLDKGALLVLYCHHGPRSRRAAEQLVAEGFRNVYNLEGGIDAWAATVDPSIPRY